jgi:hypothetical protein
MAAPSGLSNQSGCDARCGGFSFIIDNQARAGKEECPRFACHLSDM